MMCAWWLVPFTLLAPSSPVADDTLIMILVGWGPVDWNLASVRETGSEIAYPGAANKYIKSKELTAIKRIGLDVVEEDLGAVR